MPDFLILDERDIWHKAACEAARRAGFEAQRIFTKQPLQPAPEGSVGFIRPHADWRRLPQNRQDFARMQKAGLLMIQDETHVRLYEDKSGQFALWPEWMPDTWRFTDHDMAQAFVAQADYPLVSKADVGASSINVRILKDRDEAAHHIENLFLGPGVWVHHGAQCPQTRQSGYVLLQRFIPHTKTYRVNALGNARAVFFRYNYPDKPLCQTGNVDPAYEMTDELESLLDYADRFFAHAGTKWCAADILKDGVGKDATWRLIETSLAWPWPSPGDCNNGTIFRSRHKWIGMFDVMFDELKAGAWAA